VAGTNPLSLGRDIAIDLGTANTLIFVKGEGLVLNEPSYVALDARTNQVLAVGAEAKRMAGKAPKSIRIVRPLKDGVIADFDVCEQMLKQFMQTISRSRWGKPRVIVAVPSEVTGVERRAVQDAAEFAGARRPVFIIEEPMAAAIGAGLEIHQATANLIVDIGGGTTEVAVISLGGIVTALSARVGGDAMDAAIVAAFRKDLGLDIGESTAEDVKKLLGSAWMLTSEIDADVAGRDAVTGLPRSQAVSSRTVREMLEPVVSEIVDAVRSALEKTPPELAADVISRGIVLAGGGSLLTGLPERVTHETGIQTFRAPEPLLAVVLGAGMSLDNLDAMRGQLSTGEGL
jgi:rod shape-determining protein MreB